MKHMVGDITNVTKGVIVHQVNAQGVMGSGVAKAIKDKWPQVYGAYKMHYDEGLCGLGSMHMVRITGELHVCNLVGQRYYGRDGKQYTDYEAQAKALHSLKDWMNYHYRESKDVHHPMMGAGLGGGDWYITSRLIEDIIGKNTTLWTI